MNYRELCEAVADEMDKSVYAAEKDLRLIFGVIEKELLNGGEVSIASFGKFKAVKKAERNGVIPGTSEKIVIPARKTVKFAPSSLLKQKFEK